MTRRILTGGLVLVALAAGLRAVEPAAKPEAAKPAAAAKTDPASLTFEKLKKLAGTWVEADKDGKPTEKVASVVKVTSGGSVVHETFFPGQPMEMISIYHVDKGDLLMTHYCVIGNQPRMKADLKASTDKKLVWAFDGGTNLDVTKDMHMHSSVVTFLDDDTLEVAGEAWQGGKACETHCGKMKLIRKK